MDATVLKDFWLPLLLLLSTTTIAPIATAAYAASALRRKTIDDYARQDIVAARAAETAAKISRATETTNDKLDVIHTLVNSNLTASMLAELNALKRMLAIMLEQIEDKKASGRQPTIEILTEVSTTRTRIAELQAMLDDRTKQQATVELQIKMKPEAGVKK